MVKKSFVVYTDAYKVARRRCPRGQGQWLFRFKDREGNEKKYVRIGQFRKVRDAMVELAIVHGAKSMEVLP